jgi:hypothetical protein
MKIEPAPRGLPVLLFIGLACLSMLHGERRWKLHPNLDAAVERLKIGELTTIVPASVAGASDRQSREDFFRARKANDKEGVDELLAAGKIAPLLHDTEVRILERNEGDLDRLMDTVRELVDLDMQMYKDCMHANIRRASAGLRLISCGQPSFEDLYNTRFTQCMNDRRATPESLVDSQVLVLVRVLSGDAKGRKLWVLFGDLVRPSHPDPAVVK